MRNREPQIVCAGGPVQVEQVRRLFVEYAQSLGFSLSFQDFEGELADLPGVYGEPEGRLLLATVDGDPAGCAGLRKLEPGTCEMKRLYLKPQFRGLGLGRQLVQHVISEARAIGYQRMRLDTISGAMERAIQLYRQLGFVTIPPYRQNPIAGALFLELNL